MFCITFLIVTGSALDESACRRGMATCPGGALAGGSYARGAHLIAPDCRADLLSIMTPSVSSLRLMARGIGTVADRALRAIALWASVLIQHRPEHCGQDDQHSRVGRPRARPLRARCHPEAFDNAIAL